MGLFESKAEKEARMAAAKQARENQKEKFRKSEILKFIVDSVRAEENGWLTSRQNYYDCGKRIVYVFSDQFSIDWREGKMVQVQTDQGVRDDWDFDTVNSLDFAYTSYGYIPVNEDVLKIWMEVIQEQLKSVLPNCTFDSIQTAKGRTARNERCEGYRFEYTLPIINFKSWY